MLTFPLFESRFEILLSHEQNWLLSANLDATNISISRYCALLSLIIFGSFYNFIFYNIPQTFPLLKFIIRGSGDWGIEFLESISFYFSLERLEMIRFPIWNQRVCKTKTKECALVVLVIVMCAMNDSRCETNEFWCVMAVPQLNFNWINNIREKKYFTENNWNYRH